MDRFTCESCNRGSTNMVAQGTSDHVCCSSTYRKAICTFRSPLEYLQVDFAALYGFYSKCHCGSPLRFRQACHYRAANAITDGNGLALRIV
jgi:hypothetical protein